MLPTRKIALILLFWLLPMRLILAQENAQIEKELVASIQEIRKYSIYGDDYDENKLSKAQDIFEEQILKYSKVPSTLHYDFNELDEFVSIATSEDGKFRIYSWDLEDGGTMHDFERVYQYQANDGKVYSKSEDLSDEDAHPGFVTDIFTVNTDGKPIYIVCSTFMGSTSYHHQTADLYQIEADHLNDQIKLIKTKSGFTNTLSFAYNFFSVVDRKERPIRLITFDPTTKTLRIPVVIEDEEFPDGRVTNRWISYRFNGTYFVKE